MHSTLARPQICGNWIQVRNVMSAGEATLFVREDTENDRRSIISENNARS